MIYASLKCERCGRMGRAGERPGTVCVDRKMRDRLPVEATTGREDVKIGRLNLEACHGTLRLIKEGS